MEEKNIFSDRNLSKFGFPKTSTFQFSRRKVFQKLSAGALLWPNFAISSFRCRCCCYLCCRCRRCCCCCCCCCRKGVSFFTIATKLVLGYLTANPIKSRSLCYKTLMAIISKLNQVIEWEKCAYIKSVKLQFHAQDPPKQSQIRYFKIEMSFFLSFALFLH